MKPILDLAADLAQGRITSRTLVEGCLERIADKAGEGPRAFIKVNRERALAEADASDRLRKAGVVPGLLAGIPVSVKDLADIAGEVTTAGSIALSGAPPAKADAPTVARLRAAGAVIVGRTNMTEFAFGGLGLNPHYGDPRNPWDRNTGRIAGGSSAGAAVSITDDMAAAALGSDTAGSVRMPAAVCGITGFKPTQRRVPVDGTIPLAHSLDSIGPLARTVTCCAVVDAVFAGEPPRAPVPLPLGGLRFAVAKPLTTDLDNEVADAFQRALGKLSAAGAGITELPFDELKLTGEIAALGGFPTAEAYAWHRRLLERAGNQYDPIVASRLRRGAKISAADYIRMRELRDELIEKSRATLAPFDAWLAPTVQIVPYKIADAGKDEDTWIKNNGRMIRNPVTVNLLDGCALSIPCHRQGEAPVGLMVAGEAMTDHRILAIGCAVEAALS
jgi:aspartyl-tRNA(Asn)/glutamyl-tRNA(Gln) amidotransferase subunit A